MGVGASSSLFDDAPTATNSKKTLAAVKTVRLSNRRQSGQLVSHLKFEKNSMDSAHPFHQVCLNESAQFGLKDGLQCVYIVSLYNFLVVNC